ncbi:hypothetical protein CHS0354_003590 [Potamilus streckersoni]|uniref:Uncharacterized protein n=1 Tax=Potamilus streckersoni TaxID=2493646 RepID=A0AAE0SN05_9BIVA|nr:hypothetical protein CHS0354_003588 [Potamilus streckersoni]KAK3594665.1 hypothetical protein CHS0354_003589 [Potamilus streckersoni]KAK3594666.1 hypothetical protein CHS0354_003590 [Potamilus streckersoni]
MAMLLEALRIFDKRVELTCGRFLNRILYRPAMKWLENIPGLKVDGFDFTAKYEEAVNQYLHETYLIPAKGGGRHGGKSYYS